MTTQTTTTEGQTMTTQLEFTRSAVQAATNYRSANMSSAGAWRLCAIALRAQAVAMDADNQSVAAHQSRSDAWDCDEHAVRLESDNARGAVMAVRAERAAAGF